MHSTALTTFLLVLPFARAAIWLCIFPAVCFPWDMGTGLLSSLGHGIVSKPDTGYTIGPLRPFEEYTRLDGLKVELGEECDEGGRQTCDGKYNNAVICKSGEWQLKEKCGLNACYWTPIANDAGCLVSEDPEPPTPRAVVGSSGINPGCSAIFSIGANCGFDPALEGAMSCDTTCNSVGICHNGVFQVNSPCSPGHCQWREEVGQPFCV